MSNWQVVSLEEMTPPNIKYGIVDGPFGSNLKTIHYKTSGIPIITSGFVTEGIFRADKYIYVTREKYEKEKRSSVSGGDIVMAKIGARCGASAMLPHDHETGILSGNALKITIDENRFSAKLVWHLLWMLYKNGSLEKFKTVGAQPAISMSSLKKLKLRMPDLNEQKRIVDILDTWDEYQEKLDRLIDLKKKLKKSIIQKLTNHQMRLMDNNGSSYPAWEVKKIGDVAKFVNGKPFEDAITNNGKYNLITIDSIGIDGRLKANHRKVDRTDDSLKKGDLVIVLSDIAHGYLLGLTDVIPEDNKYVLNQRMGRLRTNENYNPEFIKTWINSNQVHFRRRAQGTSQRHIYERDVIELEIAVPSILEQQQIAGLMSTIDNEISILEKKKQLILVQKIYLASKLIAGIIRTSEGVKSRVEEKQHA